MTNINRFLETVTVLDTETTHLLPEQAEIVEVAGARFENNQWVVKSTLLNARNGIPPEASAKNNIGPRDIQNQPFWDQYSNEIKQLLNWNNSKYFVAHNASYDRAVIATAWRNMNYTSDIAICEDQNRWICTWRLSRQILGHTFGDIEYGLNYLRFLLDLDVPTGHGVHRAGDDTLTCALLFQTLVYFALELELVADDEDIGDQIHALCWKPIDIKTWPFGKHRGTPLEDIPNDYYVWALKNVNSLQEGTLDFDPDLADSVTRLLEKRLQPA